MTNTQDKTHIAISTYNKIAKQYTKQYFDDQSDFPYLSDFITKLPQNSMVLDVGCGPGNFSSFLLEHNFQVTGIDLSEKMISIAKQKVPGVTFLKQDMRMLKFKDQQFDGILAAYSLIHIESKDLPKTLQNFYRILKDGGYLQVIVQKGQADQIVSQPSRPSEKMFFNFFSSERLNHFLTNAGFIIDSQKQVKAEDSERITDTYIYSLSHKQ